MNPLLFISGQCTKRKKLSVAGSTSSSSGRLSVISTRHMELVVQKLLGQQTRQSTIRNYLNIWRQFNNFVMSLDVKPKFWEARTTLYIAYLIENGRQSSSIRSYVSAIKKLLVMDGYKWQDYEVLLTVWLYAELFVGMC